MAGTLSAPRIGETVKGETGTARSPRILFSAHGNLLRLDLLHLGRLASLDGQKRGVPRIDLSEPARKRVVTSAANRLDS